MGIRTIIVLALMTSCVISSAQRLAYQQGELIIQLTEDGSFQSFTQELKLRSANALELQYEPIIPNLNIWKLSFDFTKVDEHKFKSELWLHPQVGKIQFNHFVSSRATPNDPLFDDQWHHLNLLLNGNPEADLDSDLAWNITTGGLTPQGDTIVIAVIDNGIQQAHPDLQNQLWINYAEIPNNGIDDDQNGYVDDYFGYNALTENDDIEGGTHGTSVAGIIGAQGNNELGVTGINWNTKLMVIRNNFNTTEANVLASYGYVYTARHEYNLTDGERGAFVVATNSSWGRDFGQPSDAPLWCEFYDELGKVGIVNCAATANLEIDVDVEGDLPTGCSSDYLLTVTNLNSFGEKVQGAGYGKESIDLGAFGEGAFTTSNDGYDTFGGTSAAAPMATGLVGLLYAAPCNNLSNFAKTNPKMAANFVMEYILEGVKMNPALQNITSTGGQLNLHNTLSQMMNDCNECSLPSGLVTNAEIENQQTFTWTAFNSSLAVNLQYKLKEESIFNTVLNVEPPFTLEGLAPCADYEYQLESICGDTTSNYTMLGEFKTKGCCENPSDINLELVTMDQVIINWPSASLAPGYEYRFKAIDDNDWQNVDTINNQFVNLSELTACTEYIIQFRVICEGAEFFDWTSPFTFTTLGCGLCIENNFCEGYGESTSSEWIDQIDIHNYTLKSGNNNGYFAHQNEPIALKRGGDYPFSIAPGYSNQALPEQVTIWLDLNQNGSFEETELLLSSPTIDDTWRARLQIPTSATEGQCIMRIQLSWVDTQNPSEDKDPCAIFLFGEVEDICLTITSEGDPCIDDISELTLLQADLNSAIFSWPMLSDASEYKLTYNVIDEAKQYVYTNQIPTIINGLTACMMYEVSVTPLCNGLLGGESQPILFETICDMTDAIDQSLQFDYKVLRNPFQDKIAISFSKSITILSAQLFDLSGKLVLNDTNTSIATLLELSGLSHLSSGIYFLSLQTSYGAFQIKLIKQ